MFEYCREPPKIESARTGDEIEDECNYFGHGTAVDT
jgi:hypothetical protein